MTRTSFLQGILTTLFNRADAESGELESGDVAALCEALLSERGESSGARLARGILAHLGDADDESRIAFYRLLAEDYDIDADATVAAAERYRSEPTPAHLATLMVAAEPRRQELMRRLNRVPGATGQLVALRADLRRRLAEHPDLKRIDLDLHHLFGSWFNRGFLVLRQIDWHSPADVLEKIIAYEAVHAIDSWSALRQRVEPPDRRCFAFFHPAMIDEPLIFVEVALTRDPPASITAILADDRDVLTEGEADTAVFYSISNCQPGLAGVSFGNSLIKVVARELGAALPNVVHYRTLSPVPTLVSAARTIAGTPGESVDPSADDRGLTLAAARAVVEVADGHRSPYEDETVEQCKAFTADYLLEAKRDDGQPKDPVARFHLGNGASLDAILPLADPYDKGVQQSAGIMVSYLYDLERVDRNHEAYARRREVVTSGDVAKQAATRRKRGRSHA